MAAICMADGKAVGQDIDPSGIRKRYGPPSEFGYEKLIPLFKAEKWDPDALVKFFKDNGARFIMPVACHHDNFDMYDSSHPWNSVKMGPHRDTLQEWKEAATKYGLEIRRLDPSLLVASLVQTGAAIPETGHLGVEAVQHGLRSEELRQSGQLERTLVCPLLGNHRKIRSRHVQQRRALSR